MEIASALRYDNVETFMEFRNVIELIVHPVYYLKSDLFEKEKGKFEQKI